MERLLLLFLFSTINLNKVSAQLENAEWFTGKGKNGVYHFSTSPYDSNYIYSLKNGLSFQSTGSICDKYGKLLYYTNGDSIFYKTGQMVQYGYNLGGHGLAESMIIKHPTDSNLLYVIHSDIVPKDFEIPANNVTSIKGRGFSYSIVNRSKNYPVGQITAKQKNISNDIGSAAVIYACDTTFYWLVINFLYKDSFYLYKIDKEGITGPLNRIYVGRKNIKPDAYTVYHNNYIKFSPDGKLLCVQFQGKIEGTFPPMQIIQNGFIIYKFNNESGIITEICRSNLKTLQISSFEFSPNSNYLYFQGTQKNNLSNFSIYQLKIHDSLPAVIDTCDIKNNILTTGKGNSALRFLNTPNRTMLCLNWDGSTTNANILNPNQPFDKLIFKIPEFKYNLNYTLTSENMHYTNTFLSNNYSPTPFISNFPIYKNFTPHIQTKKWACIKDQSLFTLNSGSLAPVKWFWGDSTLTITQSNYAYHSYEKPGKYIITTIQQYSNINDTTKIIFEVRGPNIKKQYLDTLLCNQDSIILKIIINKGDTLFWNDNYRYNNRIIKSAGKYAYTLSDGSCSVLDTIKILKTACHKSTNLCMNDSFFFMNNLNDADSLKIINQYFNSTLSPGCSLKYKFNKNGNSIFVIKTFKENMTRVDTLVFHVHNYYDVFKFKDSILCMGKKLTTNLNNDSILKFYWNDGDANLNKTITKSGKFVIDYIDINNCKNKDSVIVNFIPCSLIINNKCKDSVTFFSYNDKVIDSIYIELDKKQPRLIKNSPFSHVYQDTGNINIKYTLFSFSNKLSLDTTIKITSSSTIILPKDTILCSNSLLKANVLGCFNYLHWSTGENYNPITIKNSGVYKLVVKNGDCISSSAASVNTIHCKCDVYVPNAFSPNNDGVNDFFEFKSSCEVKSVELKIFNRWGQKIYETKDHLKLWDGLDINGKPMEGVFIWTMHLITENNNKIHNLNGNVTIIK